MKRIYLILPCLALTAFAGYSTHWSAQQEATIRSRRDDQLDPYAHRDGSKEAQADLARGQLRVVSFGLPAPWSREYEKILREDYGIDDDTVAGCMVSEGLVKYAAAYNRVMDERIKALHGPNVFATAVAKAQKLYAEKNPPAARE